MIRDVLETVAQEVSELFKILAEDEQSRLFHLIRFVVTFAFGQHDEVIPVSGLLHLRRVGARTNRLEILLKERLGSDLGRFDFRPAGRSARLTAAVLMTPPSELNLISCNCAGRQSRHPAPGSGRHRQSLVPSSDLPAAGGSCSPRDRSV